MEQSFLAVAFKLYRHTPLFCISAQNYKQRYGKVSVGMKSILMGSECFATGRNKHPSRSKVSEDLKENSCCPGFFISLLK